MLKGLMDEVFWLPVWHVRSFAVLMMSLQKVNNPKSTTLLRSIREMKLQGKLLPLRVRGTDKHREWQFTRKKPTSRNHGNPPWNRKPKLWWMNFWRFSVDKIERYKLQEAQSQTGPCTFVSFTSRSPTRFSQWMMEKKPLKFQTEGEEKEALWNIP